MLQSDSYYYSTDNNNTINTTENIFLYKKKQKNKKFKNKIICCGGFIAIIGMNCLSFYLGHLLNHETIILNHNTTELLNSINII